jgi:hypothetical protein
VSWLAFVRDPDTGNEIGQIALDSDPVAAPVNSIFCLLCTVRERYDEFHLTCLALVLPDTKKGEYGRVGPIFLRERNWFGEWTRGNSYRGVREPSASVDSRFRTTVTLVQFPTAFDMHSAHGRHSRIQESGLRFEKRPLRWRLG